MARTIVEIDDELMARVLRRYGFHTKREAIDYALRRLVSRYEPKDMLDLEGAGWGGDLEAMRAPRYPDGYLDEE